MKNGLDGSKYLPATDIKDRLKKVNRNVLECLRVVLFSGVLKCMGNGEKKRNMVIVLTFIKKSELKAMRYVCISDKYSVSAVDYTWSILKTQP